jgi:hypothetical protein
MKAKIKLFRPDIKGIKRALNRHVKEAAELNAEMIRRSILRGKDVVSGGNFARIKGSTRFLRDWKRDVGMTSAPLISGDKPLLDTGELYSSIQVKRGGKPGTYEIVMNDYGKHHLESRTVAPSKGKSDRKGSPMGIPERFNLVGKTVPRRRFFGTPKAFLRSGEYKELLMRLDENIRKALKAESITIS